jgi:hypothetical protein
MKNIILIDIDHTISDAFWRDDLIKRSRDSGDWEEYHSRGKEDKPLEDMVNLIKLMWRGAMDPTGIELWAITARPERWRKQTTEWFIKHNIFIDYILMRPEDAFKAAPEIKIGLCKEKDIIDRILCVFDDREDVIEAFKEIGITAFQVHARRKK